MGEILVNGTYPGSYFDRVRAAQDAERTKNRSQVWKSRPRGSWSDVQEVLTFQFAARSSITSVGFDVLSVGATYEFWYYDGDDRRLPLLREGREQVRFTTRSTKTPDEWQHWEFAILPCIATKLELRMTRVADELAPQGEYSLGVRKLAIRRAVTTREQAALGLHDSVDALGNVVSKAVRDWQPEKAVDGSDETFWKCEPQVSQDAVVCLYLDVSDDEGQARFVDSLSTDPVWAGAQMNVYTSSDPTEGTRLTPFGAYDHEEAGCSYERGSGLVTGASGTVSFDLSQAGFDPQGDWTVHMAFMLGTASPDNLVLFEASGYRLTLDGHTLSLHYPLDGRTAVLRATLPDTCMRFFSGMPQEKCVDSELRVSFGVTRSGIDRIDLAARAIDTRPPVGGVVERETLADETVSASRTFSAQLSNTADGLRSTYAAPEGWTVEDGEIVVPPGGVLHIPVERNAGALTDMGGSGAVECTVTYRTDEPYVFGARLMHGDAETVTWWTGAPDASASRIALDGRDVVTNSFWDPLFAHGGRWEPEGFDGTGGAEKTGGALVITGEGRCRNLTRPASSLRGGVEYVFSAVPEFAKGTTWYRDFPLFAFDMAQGVYLATPSSTPVSGERSVIRFTAPDDPSLLSLGFTGGSKASDRVSWSKPMLCTAADWDRLQTAGLDWFDPTPSPEHQRYMARWCPELNINPLFDPSMPLIGTAAPDNRFPDRPFAGHAVMLANGYNTFPNVRDDDWVVATSGSSFAFTFHVASDGGHVSPVPYIESATGERFFADKYSRVEEDGGWARVVARVALPATFEPCRARFGLRHVETDRDCYVGGLSVSDNALAFEQWTPVTRASVSKTSTDLASDAAGFTLRNYSEHGTLYVSAIDLRAVAADLGSVGSDRARPASSMTLGRTSGTLTGFAVLQKPPYRPTGGDAPWEPFLQDPERFLAPDEYDASSTMAGALAYAKLASEHAVRGGVPDSVYEGKEWTPAIINARLERATYTLPMPVRCRWVKLEFSQLTAMQYPLESDGVVCRYMTFPRDLDMELADRFTLERATDVKNPDVPGVENIRRRITEHYSALAASNPNMAASTMRGQYWTPDVTVLNGRLPVGWIPGGYENPVSDLIGKESTSSAFYSGVGSTTAAAVTSSGSADLSSLCMQAAEYMIYDAFVSDDLLAIARDHDIADWRYDFRTDRYADDGASRAVVSGRSPGMWLLPGRVDRLSTQAMLQMTSTARADVVRRHMSLSPTVAVTDTRTATPSTGIVGPKGFSRTCVHWYDERVEARTQSIAYVTGLREVTVRAVDMLRQHDVTAWKLYSMALPVWHLSGGHLTPSDIFVPDLTPETDRAVAWTDPMQSQSHFRSIKVLSVNRDALTNRTYFPLGDVEAWHGPDYWYTHPELDCTWADDSPDDPSRPGDVGGAWASNRYAWGESWTGSIVSHREWNVWYAGELVRHITVSASERVFDHLGRQVPFVVDLGETFLPPLALVKIGASLCMLKRANPDGRKATVRVQLMSGQFGNELIIDEQVDLDSNALSAWQEVASSRVKVMGLGSYPCRVRLSFTDFEELDLYLKSGFIETGTILVEARNTQEPDGSDWEDITSVVGRKDSIYTFRHTNNDFQLRVTMLDPQDWFGSLIVIPLYVPYEDAVDYAHDDVLSLRMFVQQDGGQWSPVSSWLKGKAHVGRLYQLGVAPLFTDGTVGEPRSLDVVWTTSNEMRARVNELGVMAVKSRGLFEVTASYGGVSATERIEAVFEEAD